MEKYIENTKLLNCRIPRLNKYSLRTSLPAPEQHQGLQLVKINPSINCN